MRSIFRSFRQLLRRADGNAAVEYALLIAGVTTIVVTIVFSLGTTVRAGFKGVCDSLGSRIGAPACNDGVTPAPVAPPAPPPSPPHDD